MSYVSSEDKVEMTRILESLNGITTSAPSKNKTTVTESPVELAGPGGVTSRDIDDMAQVMSRLNSISSDIKEERFYDPQLNEAIDTKRINNGVKIQNYQITIKEDASRLAGKQYYSIYHSASGNVIADDISLYEVALSVVKLLNNGKYVNSVDITRLFEADDRYTSNRTDAIRFKRKIKIAESKNDYAKSDLFESRYQRSINNAMEAKREVKKILMTK